MILFNKACFFTTVNHLKDLPDVKAEIAFAGRSNAGKSSAINTLTQQTRLAYVSKTPGRTQHINYFDLSEDRFLVDLPGYGYAAVPEAVRAHWVELLGSYLQTRSALVGLILIMDARHPLKELDWRMLNFFRVTGKPVHILLSKSDKLNQSQKQLTLKFVREQLRDRPEVSVQLFSSLKKQGLQEVEARALEWFSHHAEQIDPLLIAPSA